MREMRLLKPIFLVPPDAVVPPDSSYLTYCGQKWACKAHWWANGETGQGHVRRGLGPTDGTAKWAMAMGGGLMVLIPDRNDDLAELVLFNTLLPQDHPRNLRRFHIPLRCRKRFSFVITNCDGSLGSHHRSSPNNPRHGPFRKRRAAPHFPHLAYKLWSHDEVKHLHTLGWVGERYHGYGNADAQCIYPRSRSPGVVVRFGTMIAELGRRDFLLEGSRGVPNWGFNSLGNGTFYSLVSRSCCWKKYAYGTGCITSFSG